MTDRMQMIEERLKTALEPRRLEVIDDSARHAGHEGTKSGGGHYVVTIVSSKFAGHNLVQRHRMVYEALGDAMRMEIHALSIRAKTPEEA